MNGPWHVNEAGVWVDDKDGNPVAMVSARDREGRARLIAAAPDLLDALRALRKVFETHPAFQNRDYVSLAIQVNNAIVKADLVLHPTPAETA